MQPSDPDIVENDPALGALRQLFEGARPTLARLALLSGRPEAELAALAEAGAWQPVRDGIALRRRVTAMADRLLGQMETLDEGGTVDKSRLDAVALMLKAVERLHDFAAQADAVADARKGETDVAAAFAAIDNRIAELAHAYAQTLVEGQSQRGTGTADD